jgi:shikimate kinase
MGKPVFLIGYMGSGKSTNGRKLARSIGYFHFDLDEEIEKLVGKSIDQIFSEEGEDAFRLLEHSVLVSLTNRKNIVVSTGGGTPCYFNNLQLMKVAGVVVYIKMKPESLAKRLQSSKVKRPIIVRAQAGDLSTFITQHLAQREDFYKQAHLTIKGENLDFEILQNSVKESL